MSQTTTTVTIEAALSIAVRYKPQDDTYLAEVRFDAEDEHHAMLLEAVERLIKSGALEAADHAIGDGGCLAFRLGWLRHLRPEEELNDPGFMRGYVAGYLDNAVAEAQSA